MSEPIFSASWYRVAELRPRLRTHARIHRHNYRGKTWFVLQDFSTGRFHRFTPAAYRVIGLMDGSRTVNDIWRISCEQLGDDAPTQDGMIQLLAQLHRADVLQSDVPPDTAELLLRRERQERSNWLRRAISPFAVRIPLIDPENFLRRTESWVTPLVGWVGIAVWCAVVLPAVVVAGLHFSELTEGVLGKILTPRNLIFLWILFPLVKTVHEFAHAYVAKAFGAEIHDMGIMLLVFTPVPYVDASGASAFRRRSQRVAVGVAGIVAELFLAAIAMYLWATVESGAVRALAFNVIVISSVTTLAFNANPLLRFDGYYILADLLEIPNLGQRSTRYIGYLLERYVIGRREAEPPEATAGERAWLLTYGVASFVYRLLVIAWIAVFVLEWSFVLGVLLLAFSSIGWVIMPATRAVRFLLLSPRLQRVRGRAVGLTAGAAATILLALGFVPVPLRTHAEGVVWIPDEAYVRAGSDGFIVDVAARPGARVDAGDVLFECSDPVVEAEVRALEAQVRELEARYVERRPENIVESQLVREELGVARRNLARERERAAEGRIRSRAAGSFVAPRAIDLPGRFVRQGEVLGHVVDLDTITVRAVIPQDDFDLMRERLRATRVRLAERVSDVLPAVVRRVVPTASERLPSPALGTGGGGEIAIDPRQQDGASALERLFDVELELPADAGILNVGGRVYVRFDLGSEPLFFQWYRRVRQLFLARFNV
jgi:putative peptide zinc metalloprotease protein